MLPELAAHRATLPEGPGQALQVCRAHRDSAWAGLDEECQAPRHRAFPGEPTTTPASRAGYGRHKQAQTDPQQCSTRGVAQDPSGATSVGAHSVFLPTAPTLGSQHWLYFVLYLV